LCSGYWEFLLVLHDRNIILAGSVLGWVASFLSPIGITVGTLYQKRYCGYVDWRAGNFVQYIGAGVLFTLGAVVFETRAIHWTRELIFAMAWLVLVLSIAAVALMYWLIRRSIGNETEPAAERGQENGAQAPSEQSGGSPFAHEFAMHRLVDTSADPYRPLFVAREAH
jgi:hypothetical protein